MQISVPRVMRKKIKILKNISGLDEFSKHEKVIEIRDNHDLRAYIAVHNTKLGPATGGTRLFPYSSEREAINDVLRLSRAMTYKCALAGLPFGGGKGVIVGDEFSKSERMLRVYGQCINTLNGLFTTGTDLGISSDDTGVMSKESGYILGQPEKGVIKMDSSQMAALGVFYGMKGVLTELYGSPDFTNKKISVKGIGKLGGTLLPLLIEAGANVTVADTDYNKILQFKNLYHTIQITDVNDIHKKVVDIYSPCAVGNEFDEKTVEELNTRSIVGGANNQLASPSIGDLLYERGITYAPDYVVNAGGLINIVSEMQSGGYNAEKVLEKIKSIEQKITDILQRSRQKNISPHRIADTLAENIINS